MKLKHLVATCTALIGMTVTFPLVPTLAGCDACSEVRWGYEPSQFDRYAGANPNHVTPAGTPYDPSGLDISPQLIDRLTSEVEACLLKAKRIDGPIDRRSFNVKVASDWIPSCDGSQQLLPVLAGSAGCIAKGLTPTEQCPCRYRAGIRCPNELITTPSFYIYKDVLIRYVLTNEDPWADPQLAQCATPSTTPLSDGTDPNNGL